jgi:hypothetical protein
METISFDGLLSPQLLIFFFFFGGGGGVSLFLAQGEGEGKIHQQLLILVLCYSNTCHS